MLSLIKKLNKKKFIVVLLTLLFFVFSAHSCHAQGWFGIGSIISSVITGVCYFIANIVAWLAARILELIGWIMDFVINESYNITSSNSAVSTGWGYCLSFANLGFVLAMVVSAFGTIFRIQGYQFKEIVRNLVIAAVLINFSFYIAGGFIDLGNGFSKFFMKSIQAGGCSDQQPSCKIVGSVAIQKLVDIQKKNWMESGGDNNKKSAGDISVQSLSILAFVIIFTFLTIVTMAAITIMLLIRYVKLAVLVVLSPFIWVGMIFKATNKYWKTWWYEFIKWCFFAPVMMFFIYLAMLMSSSVAGNLSTKDDADMGLSMQTVGGLVVCIAVLWIGLLAASKMQLDFAGEAGKWRDKGLGWMKNNLLKKPAMAGVGAAGAGVGALGGAMGRGASNLATAKLRTQEGKDRIKELQGSDNLLKRMQGNRLARIAAKAEALDQKWAEEKLKKRAPGQAEAGFDYLSDGEQKLELARRLKDGTLNDLGEETLNKIMGEGSKKKFESSGHGELHKNLVKATLRNEAIIKAQQENNTAVLEDEYKKLFASLDPRDIAKDKKKFIIDEKDTSNEQKEIKRARLRAMLDQSPESISKILPQLSSKERRSLISELGNTSLIDKEKDSHRVIKTNETIKVQVEAPHETLIGANGKPIMVTREETRPKEVVVNLDTNEGILEVIKQKAGETGASAAIKAINHNLNKRQMGVSD